MAILSLSEIPGLNADIEAFGYTIHVHDACGGQSFELKAIAGSVQKPEIFEFLESYFAQHRMKLKYYTENKLNFTAK